MGFPLGRRVMAAADEIPHGATAVGGPAQHIEEHAVGDLEAGDESFRCGGLKARERVEIPADETLLRLPALELLSIPFRFFLELQILDDVFGCLGDDPAAVIEALAAGAPGDLVKIASGEDADLLAVEFGEAGKQDGADGDVDTDAEGVGSADDFEQAALGELFDEHAVLGEKPGVVEADAVAEPALDLGAVGAGELEALNGGGDGGFLLARTHIEAGEILGALRGVGLGEMDDVNGGLAAFHEEFEGFGEGRFRVGELEGYGAVLGFDGDRRAAVEAGQFLFEEGGVAEGGGHQEEAGLVQGKQRRLPGDAAVAVGIPVKLIHHDVLDLRVGAFAQGDVGEDLGGATQDGSVPVDGGIAGAETDVVGAEFTAERHPFLIHKCLDGARVDRSPAGGEGLEMQGGRHE